MKKILEALKGLLPEDKAKPVAEAVNTMIDGAKAELEKEYDNKLQEAYAHLADELKKAEGTAETGYQEAYSIIQELRGRLETQQAEFESAMDEGYEEAYQMLVGERGKNEKLEVDIYEEYDKKLADMKEYMVDKIDEFLNYKTKQLVQEAKKEASNDPTIAETKVTLDRIVELVGGYITDEDYTLATSSKLEEALKMLEELRGKQRILEARNIRLSTENKKLNEAVRTTGEALNESTKNKKERAESAKNVTGRGKRELDNVEVIAEHNETPAPKKDTDNTLVESYGKQMDDMKVLAGLAKAK
jgi:hypothetical protein